MAIFGGAPDGWPAALDGYGFATPRSLRTVEDVVTQEAKNPGKARHEAPDGADRHPLIDLSRDPTPGVPDHAAPEPNEANQSDQQGKPGIGD